MYSHLLICTQLRLSNLSTDCLIVKAWGLPPLGVTVSGEFVKPVGRNRPLLFVMRCQLLYWIAKVMARWQRPKAGRPMAIGLDGYTSWRLRFWYTIGCMRAWLGRVESGVNKEVYLVYWRYVSGIRYQASNNEGLEWRTQSMWNNLQLGSSDRNTRIA